MSARLRLDLIVRREWIEWDDDEDDFCVSADRWTWRLWSGSRIVSSSGSQRYSRRIDCARGAEVGAGICGVTPDPKAETVARRYTDEGMQTVIVRVIDERAR